MEIDCKDRYSFTRLNYMDRMGKIIAIVKASYPASPCIRIGDFAAAQGNQNIYAIVRKTESSSPTRPKDD
jgi:hypothetical protein